MKALLGAGLLKAQADERLVRLAGDGSEAAFEALVLRYRGELSRYAGRLLGAAAAEDVVQETFLRAWLSLQSGAQVGNARAWLYRIAHNKAIDALRASAYDHDELREALAVVEGPEAEVERRAIVRKTLAGIAGLPEGQRRALLQVAVEGLSQEQASRALGVSEGAVRQLVFRARSSLRTAASAVTPWPLACWAASLGRPGEPGLERIAEIAAAGAGAGGSAIAVKSGVAILVAGSIAAPAAVLREREPRDATEAAIASSAPPPVARPEPPARTSRQPRRRAVPPKPPRRRESKAATNSDRIAVKGLAVESPVPPVRVRRKVAPEEPPPDRDGPPAPSGEQVWRPDPEEAGDEVEDDGPGDDDSEDGSGDSDEGSDDD